MNLLFLALGGASGVIVRYLLSKIPIFGPFPYGTFIANMLGTFLLGWLVGKQLADSWMFLLAIGFCGALTTFSTLQWELVQLRQRRNKLLYASLTYSLGIIMAVIGYSIAN